MAARLSVNINKYALLRNSRGHDAPNLLRAADACLRAGAAGITVHPRRDQRHVRLDDVVPLARHLRAAWPGVEYNVECENHPDLVALVLEARPDQCTLVPVSPGEVTSDHGFDPVADREALRATTAVLRAAGVRSSCFADVPEVDRADALAAFADTGTDRVELYTGPYAWAWGTPERAAWTARVWAASAAACAVGLGVNAGHDLDRENLRGLAAMPGLREVSIGHAQICRALEVGTSRSVQELLDALAP